MVFCASSVRESCFIALVGLVKVKQSPLPSQRPNGSFFSSSLRLTPWLPSQLHAVYVGVCVERLEFDTKHFLWY